MNGPSINRMKMTARPNPRLTPLAACLAAALAFSASSALVAGEAGTEAPIYTTRAQLLNSVPSGEAMLADMTEAQAAKAEKTMRRMLGLPEFAPLPNAVIPVSNCNNSGAGSLRSAVAFASSGDTIDMTSLACSINLASSIITSVSDLKLEGNPDSLNPIISGQDAIRPLVHLGTGELTLSGVTITGGNVSVATAGSVAGGCVFSSGNVILQDFAAVKYCTARNTGSGITIGGGIYSAGYTSVLSDSYVSGNEAIANSGSTRGGGIYAKGDVTVKYGRIANNDARNSGGSGFSRGGGIYTGEDLITKYATISGNIASSDSSPLDTAGGAWVDGGSLIQRSTISGNRADSAAAMLLGRDGTGASTINQSTIANNSATASLDKYGGGMFLGNATTIRNTTISGNTEKNSADEKYGAGFKIKNGTSVTMSSTIVSGNTLEITAGSFLSNIRGTDGTPATVSGNRNLIGFSTFVNLPADTINSSSPQLGPLANNGGVTRTMAVLPGSPAINKGAANGFTTDQRGPGFIRTFGPAPDIGAFEIGGDSIFFNGFDSN